MRTMLVVLSICCAAATARAAQTLYATTVDSVDVKIFIPDDVKVLRGLIVHAAHYTIKDDDRWAEMCRVLHWGHIALNIDLKLTNRPTKLRKGLDEGLKRFAAESGHPELVHLPFAGTGHSAGGMVTSVLLRTPERAITTSVSCGWIMDPAAMKPEEAAVPYVATLGAVPDDFKMLPGIEQRFIPARQKGLPWGLALQWHCAHDFANSATLFVPWTQAVAEMRLPHDWDPLKGPPQLRAIRQEDGWLGDRSTTEGNFATIAAFSDYKGDRSQAVWLPNRSVAQVWRAMASKDAPVVLQAASADGKAKLGAYNPKAERGMMINPGVDLDLSVTVADGSGINSVRYYAGDKLIGESAAAPWRIMWKNVPQGPHAVFAVWTGPDGREGTTSPTLIVRRKTAKP